LSPETRLLHPVDDWQAQLRDAIASARELLDALGLDAAATGHSPRAHADFPLKVPRAFVARMRPGDPRDPLLLQVLASGRELEPVAGFSHDPVGETAAANPRRGIIHKYRGRVLLLVTGNCAVHCRYCFRRHFPYEANQNSRREWEEALAYVAADTDLSEVILSGGDPLLAADRYLEELVGRIAAIPHVRRLRIHTRLPVVIPRRVTQDLLTAIRHPRLQTVVVIHANHANEIDPAVGAAMGSLAGAGITLLNQSVLLAGVNDSVDALCELSERLFRAGVLPYYLHLLDPVQGAAHFDVPETRARELVAQVSARLPGYLVPRLVREVAGAEAKRVIAPAVSRNGELKL